MINPPLYIEEALHEKWSYPLGVTSETMQYSGVRTPGYCMELDVILNGKLHFSCNEEFRSIGNGLVHEQPWSNLRLSKDIVKIQMMYFSKLKKYSSHQRQITLHEMRSFPLRIFCRIHVFPQGCSESLFKRNANRIWQTRTRSIGLIFVRICMAISRQWNKL